MANEIYQQILTNQNAEYRANQAQRESIDTQLTKALSTLNTLANRVYGYTHEAIVTDDLEKDYNLIINGGYQRLYNPPIDWATEYASYYYLDDTVYRLNTSPTWDWNVEYYKKYTPNSDLANVSAVGMLAVLNHGVYTAVPTQPDGWETNYDKYFYLTSEGYIFNTDSTWNPNRSYFSYSGDAVRTQGNRLFINGDKSDGYTFRGTNSQDGIEFVKIWWFNSTTLTLQELKTFKTVNCIIKKMQNGELSILSDNLDSDSLIVEGNFTPDMTSAVVSNINLPTLIIAKATKRYTCRIVSSGPQYNTLTTNNFPFLTNLIFSDLVDLTTFDRFITNLSNTEFEFHSLQSIANSLASSPKFSNVKKLVLPETLVSVGAYCIGTGTNTVVLNGRKASYDTNWCSVTPTNFYMASDWETTINISKAAYNWQPEQFTTIPAVKDPTDTYYLYNLLKTVEYTPNAHVITIPQAYVTDDLIDAYMNIGWDLLGA